MPAFAADYFGSSNVGPIYGLMLTAWGFASAFGPLLIAYMRQATGSYGEGLRVIAGVMAVSVVLPMIVSPPRRFEEGLARLSLNGNRQLRTSMRFCCGASRAQLGAFGKTLCNAGYKKRNDDGHNGCDSL